jgi:regulator of sigma E protease
VITVLAFIFVLGVLVFVHELGHFLAAKRVGIRVLKFQLGFNPTIVSFRRGDTEYGIGALPLGGYVKMAGENPEEVERDEHGNPIVQADEFLAKTKWQRFQVLIMGPIMNLLLAVTLTAVVNHHGMERGSYENQPVIVGVVTEGSAAEKAGIQPGDKIVSVNGDSVDTWNQFLNTVATVGGREVDIVLLHNGLQETRKVTPALVGRSRFEIGDRAGRKPAPPATTRRRSTAGLKSMSQGTVAGSGKATAMVPLVVKAIE